MGIVVGPGLSVVAKCGPCPAFTLAKRVSNSNRLKRNGHKLKELRSVNHFLRLLYNTILIQYQGSLFRIIE